MSAILIIDDDTGFSSSLREEVEAHGHRVDCAERVDEGLKTLAHHEFDLVLLDNQMPGLSGLEALEEFEKRGIHVPVIMMTGQGTSETAIRASLLGAFDYVLKEIDVEKLVERLEPKIRQAVAIGRKPEPAVPTDEARDKPGEQRLLGNSEPMLNVLRQIGQVAPSAQPVLIYGETGTGKELVAAAIHHHSPRTKWFALNVAAITESLLESELFGHERGVYTGADRIRKGHFEYADGGTLFLDEIGEMPLDLQATLLRVLDNQEVRRIGSNTSIKVDVRVVCATNRDLSAEVEQGTFRRDLYYRLAAFPITLPPLRERGGDLAVLGRHFRNLAARNANRPVPTVHPDAIALLRAYSWPGNVRELRNVLTRAVLQCRGAEILPEHLDLTNEEANAAESPAGFCAAIEQGWSSGQPDLRQRLCDELDRELIRFAMQQCGNNQTEVSRRLGLGRNKVRDLVQRHCRPDIPHDDAGPTGQ